MNLFQLVIKQMRQRALSTWLTLFSVMLGVGLAIAILVLGRESREMFGQHSYGYDVVVGKKASKLQLVMNTVYHLDRSPGNIAYSVYGTLNNGELSKYAGVVIPTVVGDTLDGKYRIIGTLPKMFGVDDSTGKALAEEDTFEYKPDERFRLSAGAVFKQNRFEAIIGSDITTLTHGKYKLGDTFQATHGTPLPNETPDIHPEVWKIVGVLAPTHTAADRCVYIPLLSFYTIAEHGVGLMVQEKLRAGELPTAKEEEDTDVPITTDADGTEHHKNYTKSKDGTIHITLDPESWALSAIIVKSRGGNTGQTLLYDLNNDFIKDVMAANPAEEMRGFFDTFLAPMQSMLLIICSLVSFVAAVGILVSIYNSVSARLKEIAIIRALGATRATVLAMICLEAGLVALIGAVAGLVLGHLVCLAGSVYMRAAFGEGIGWFRMDQWEPLYLLAVVILALLAGLVPALKAYRTPVATNLVGS